MIDAKSLTAHYFIIASSIIWWAISWKITKTLGGFTLKKYSPLKVSIFELCLSFFLFLLPYALIGMMLTFFQLNQFLGVFTFTSSLLSLFIVLIPLTMIIGKRIWYEKERSYLKDFLYGVTAWLWAYPVILALSRMTALFIRYLDTTYEGITQVPIEWLKEQSEHPFSLILAVIQIVVLAPIIEEFLFRGVLQRFLRQYLPKVKTWLLTAFLFSAIHFRWSQGVSNIEILIALFALSLLLSFTYEKTASLFSPIGLHLTFNAITTTVVIFS